MDTYGIIGWPVKHSLSPAMHNAAFKALGIDAEYRKFEVKPTELEDFLLNRKDVLGFNVTVPYKVRAKQILDNLVGCQNGNLRGCQGLSAALKRLWLRPGKIIAKAYHIRTQSRPYSLNLPLNVHNSHMRRDFAMYSLQTPT